MLHISSARVLQLKELEKIFHKRLHHKSGYLWICEARGKKGNSSISEIRYFSLTPISTYKKCGLFYFLLPLPCQTVRPFTLLCTHPIIYQFQLFPSPACLGATEKIKGFPQNAFAFWCDVWSGRKRKLISMEGRENLQPKTGEAKKVKPAVKM